MSEFLKNTSGQGILVSVVGTDGAAKTSGVDFYVSKDAGGQAAAGGTATHRGNGQWHYAFTQAETNADLVGLAWAGTDVVPGGVSIYTTTKRVRDLNDASNAVLEGRITADRAGYLDKLNVSGTLAHSNDAATYKADVSGLSTLDATAVENAAAAAIAAADPATGGELATAVGEMQSWIEDLQFNTRVDIVVPRVMERPDSGSMLYKIWLNLYDSTGGMEAPDSTPTVQAHNHVGDSRAANLGTVTLEGTGRYSFTYSVADAHAIEQIVFTVLITEGGSTRTYNRVTIVVDTTAVDFTSADRTKLDAIHGKLPSAAYLLGGSNADGTGYSTFNQAIDTVARVALVDECTANADMRGTDGAYTGTPATAVEIREEIDSNSTKTGYRLAADATVTLAAAQPSYAPAKAGDAMALTAGERTTAAAVIRAEIDANSTKTGYKLAADGLDTISTAAPAGVASNFREMMVQVWRRFFKKSTLTETELKTFADDGSTVLTTQTVSDDGETQTQGDAT